MMKNNEKYSDHLELMNDVYAVANLELFFYLDFLLLSFFLGFLLYSQTHSWLIPSIISTCFFVLFSIIFKLFFYDEKLEK
jgi:hypothetical protein